MKPQPTVGALSQGTEKRKNYDKQKIKAKYINIRMLPL